MQTLVICLVQRLGAAKSRQEYNMRSPCCGDKNSIKKGPWSPEEDQKFVHYIHKHGHGKWRVFPKLAGEAAIARSEQYYLFIWINFHHIQRLHIYDHPLSSSQLVWLLFTAFTSTRMMVLTYICIFRAEQVWQKLQIEVDKLLEAGYQGEVLPSSSEPSSIFTRHSETSKPAQNLSRVEQRSKVRTFSLHTYVEDTLQTEH